MTFTADINVMPHRELLDPQGKTVAKNLHHLDIHGVDDVRIGKRISMTLQADSLKEAEEKVEAACRKLLANMIMETYTYTVSVA